MVTGFDINLIVLMPLALQLVSSLMVGGAGMKLICFNALGLIGGKFSNGGYRWNESDSLDALGLTESKLSDSS